MEIRLAGDDDLMGVMRVFDVAKGIMRRDGNYSQWADGYPYLELMAREIADGHCFLVIDEGEIVATFCLIFGEDPTYNIIEGGKWLNSLPYATIHRLASTGKIKGIGEMCINWAYSKYGNIRVDTHEHNRIMLGLMKKLGFIRCGIIYVHDKTPRIAFQKTNPQLFQS